MADRRGNLILLLAGVGLVLTIVSVVLPWWNVTGSAFGFTGQQSAAPFSTGGMGENVINAAAVDAVGVLCLFGIVSVTGGLVLYLAAFRNQEEVADPAPWLLLAAGALYIIGPVVAVVAWPDGDLGFWSQGSGGFASFESAAAVGWYLALVAGALTGGAGMVGIEPLTEQDQDQPPVQPASANQPQAEAGTDTDA